MAENWTAVAAEIAEGLAEVGFTATLLRAQGWQPARPWDTGQTADPEEFSVTVMDNGIRETTVGDSLQKRRARVVTVAAGVVVPVVSDRLTLRGRTYEIAAVAPLAPGGADLLYDLTLTG